jgi:NTE family protein
VGLVLGAGGVLGGAWLIGALHAIATETGWDPGSCEYLLGTSAGAMIGSLIACGVPPWLMVAHSSGETIAGLRDARGEPASGAGRSGGARFRLHRSIPPLGPGSWRLALASLARPYRYSPATFVAGWMPHGPVSTEPLKEMVRRVCAEPWAPHPNFWTVAVDYDAGRRVVFGRRDAPAAELPDAVAASCAIPGFFRAVSIGDRRYVDGGVRSASNLDVLEHEPVDLVVVLNPMSSLHAAAPRTLGERLAFAVRQASGRRLGSEAKRLRAAGIEVLPIQPTVHDLDAMGSNLMSRSRRHSVIETAVSTVSGHLRESPAGERLAQLPSGAPQLVRRPRGAATSWPELRSLARARWKQSPRPRAGAR